ncbi:hypothetical protein THRCLA_02881, partial [Thraustotheca clavata]
CGEVVCGSCIVPRLAKANGSAIPHEVFVCISCVKVCEKHKHDDSRCFVCTRDFHLFRRKYNCDLCQEGVCNACFVFERDHIPGDKHVKQRRVCMNCTLNAKVRAVEKVSLQLYDPTIPIKQSPPMPEDEDRRVQALESYEIIDILHQEELDIDCKLASRILQCPIAGLTLMDRDRQWFTSRIGFNHDEVPRDIAMGAYVVANKAPLVVLDTLLDKRFMDNPLVTGPAKIRFYAGAPIVTREGHAIGTVFVMDTQPRQACNTDPLEKLAIVAMKNIEDHKRSKDQAVRSESPLKKIDQQEIPNPASDLVV